jgi:ABC-2 type transport system permease protein
MFSLVLKDILIQKRTFIFGLFYIPIMVIAFQNSPGSMISAGIIGMMYIVLITACANDDKYNTDILLNSLPIRRNNIVLSKYISVLVYFIIGIADYLIFSSIVNILGLPFKVQPISIEDLLSTMVAVVLVFGTYLPIFYKFGYIKSRTIAFILFFGVFLFIGAITGLLQENMNASFFKEIGSSLGEGGTASGLLILLVTVLVFTGSYLLSVKFYNNRDF